MMNCVSKLEKLVSFDLVIGENNSVGIEGSKIIGKGLMVKYLKISILSYYYKCNF